MFQKTFTAVVRNFKTITNGFLKLIDTSVSLIVCLMAKDFIAFVIGSFLIALPAAWWLMNNGIPDFLYLASKIGWLSYNNIRCFDFVCIAYFEYPDYKIGF